jgi:hypothetical protein
VDLADRPERDPDVGGLVALPGVGT